MTAVPGTERETVQLICDRCGAVTAAAGAALRDTDVVWPVTTEYGWAGSPFATGPHQCPACAADPPRPAAGSAPAPAGADPAGGWRIEVYDGAVVVVLGGDLTVRVVEPLRALLSEALDRGARLVLDLTDVDQIDSYGLGLLVRAHRAAKHRGGVLCLAAPSRFVVTVLHTMRLGGVFPQFDGRPQALDWLAAPAATVPGQPLRR